MKSWKKRWVGEIDKATPALREDVKNAPIDASENLKTPKQSLFSSLFENKRRLIATLSACVCALLIVGVAIWGTLLPDRTVTPASDSSTASELPQARSEILSLEINPRAAFVVDGEGLISSVVSFNADADVILGNDRIAQIEGKTVEEGIRTYVDYAARLGYLNLTDGDAIRLSAKADENSCLQAVNDSLEGYFREKGAFVAIVSETLAEEEFAQRLGVEAAEDGTLQETLESQPDLFSTREAEGKTEEELKELYLNNLSLDEIKREVEELVSEYADKIEEQITEIEELIALNKEIREHKDNPLQYWADYFELKRLSEWFHEEESFFARTEKMHEKLAGYAENYGVEFSSAQELENELSKAKEALLALDIEKFFLEMTVENFAETSERVKQFLKGLGVSEDKISAIFDIPADAEDYIDKAQTQINDRFEQREKENKEKYEEERKELSQEEYAEYLQRLIEEYGSLAAYWESQENN